MSVISCLFRLLQAAFISIAISMGGMRFIFIFPEPYLLENPDFLGVTACYSLFYPSSIDSDLDQDWWQPLLGRLCDQRSPSKGCSVTPLDGMVPPTACGPGGAGGAGGPGSSGGYFIWVFIW